MQANDSITITPGTGATVATHTAGGKEHQVVVIADKSGHLLDTLDTWHAWVEPGAFAANKHHATIHNAAASGKIVTVRRIYAVNLQTVAVTGVVCRFDFKRTTATPTNGSTVTPVAADTSNTPLPAGITVRHSATTGLVEGGTLWAQTYGTDEATAANTAAANLIQASTNWVPSGPNIQEIVLRENEGLTIKQITSTIVGTFGWLIVFTVE